MTAKEKLVEALEKTGYGHWVPMVEAVIDEELAACEEIAELKALLKKAQGLIHSEYCGSHCVDGCVEIEEVLGGKR